MAVGASLPSLNLFQVVSFPARVVEVEERIPPSPGDSPFPRLLARCREGEERIPPSLRGSPFPGSPPAQSRSGGILSSPSRRGLFSA